MQKPTIKECFEWSNNMEQSTLFYHHFEAIDWMVGKRGNARPMLNWKSALTGWIKRSKPKASKVEKAISNTSNKLIDLLWVRMTEIYGHKWVSSYGIEPTKPWVDLVSRMSNEQIGHGLSLMIKEGGDWPVSLIKFNQFCQCYRKSITQLRLPSRRQITNMRKSTEQTRNTAMKEIRLLLV